MIDDSRVSSLQYYNTITFDTMAVDSNCVVVNSLRKNCV